MADITYTNTATVRKASTTSVAGKGNANVLQVLCAATIELAASASGTTVKIGRIPSNARISALSRIYNDDLATSGSPTLDLGLASVNSNITSDPDALTNGISLSAAGSDQLAIAFADEGLPAWDFVNGQTSDPKGSLDVYASVVDAATTATGTITVEILGYLD